jgi:hypothetical protein
MTLPVYFRLHPHSSAPFPAKKLWLSILHTPSVAELKDMTMREHPGTVVHKIEGLVTDRSGHDSTIDVTNDEELGAYLEHVRGGKATFVVLLGVFHG